MLCNNKPWILGLASDAWLFGRKTENRGISIGARIHTFELRILHSHLYANMRIWSSFACILPGKVF